MAIAHAPVRKREIYYPESDGKPMGETDKHVVAMHYLLGVLRARYADDPNVYVACDNMLYYEEGNPRKCVSPDVYVVFGIPNHLRRIYKAWEEGRYPDVIFEITSRKTRLEDERKKLPLYERVFRTSEVFQFDPYGEYLKPRLIGHRLIDGRYVRIELVDGRMTSEALDIVLGADGDLLRIFDPTNGEPQPTYTEAHVELERLRREIEELRSRR